ncbi:hypothetical protein [Paenarthrobacter ureafaciens]|uniref:hypothetical protein n=1 Tax=Paenarthrobacter ureafaciens TaxID=37931 RepID=UPI00140AD05F|nr:hypothetical protein [Paenarthrobacter ureafaciens]MCX8455338.1 hypothetical protein [Paenarthrobacter ureafaciens]MCY0974065.1 hypothetical protein [Paenarthrobacter ureafaciens]
MASYGFKLIKIELREGQRQPIMDFGECQYLQRVHEDVTAAIKRREEALAAEEKARKAAESAVDAAESSPAEDGAASASTPSDQDETLMKDEVTGEVAVASSDDVINEAEDEPSLDKTAKKVSVVRFEESIALKQAVLLRVQYGKVGDHEKGVDPEGRKKDTDLKKLATTRSYRIMLIAPPQGSTGFLAAEVISRSHAAKQIPRRLFQAARDHRFKIKPFGPIADSAAVKKLVKDGSVKEVQLFKTFIPSDSQTPVAEDVVLTFKIGEKKSQVARILQRVSNWIPRGASDSPDEEEKEALSPVQEAHSLASILWSDLEDTEFDDVKVKVTNAKQNRTLQPLDMREGFIYDLGESPVSDDDFCLKVNEAASVLFSNHEMDMEADWYLPKPSK